MPIPEGTSIFAAGFSPTLPDARCLNYCPLWARPAGPAVDSLQDRLKAAGPASCQVDCKEPNCRAPFIFEYNDSPLTLVSCMKRSFFMDTQQCHWCGTQQCHWCTHNWRDMLHTCHCCVPPLNALLFSHSFHHSFPFFLHLHSKCLKDSQETGFYSLVARFLN